MVTWFSHLFKTIPQVVVIHGVNSLIIVNEAKVDVVWEFPCFLCDPTDVENLISASFALSNSSLYI